MKNLSLFLALLLVPALSYARVNGGGQEGGGGNGRGLEFKAIALQALDDLATSGLPSTGNEKLTALRHALDSAIILSVSGGLTIHINGFEQECAVMNIPQAKTILVGEKWDEIPDFRIKKALTIHELEGILLNEPTGVYRLSAAYLTYTGFQGDPRHIIEIATGKLPAKKKRQGPLQEYLCYEDFSKQTGVVLTANHESLVSYFVGVRNQNGDMYSDGVGKQSIVVFKDINYDGLNFTLSGGKAIDDKDGRYTDVYGFEKLDLRYDAGALTVLATKKNGNAIKYVGCYLRSTKD